MKKNKLLTAILLFLLIVPFRLPISVLFIYAFEHILNLASSTAIPEGIRALNVVTSKIIYNIAISSAFIYNIEMYSREKKGRKAIGSFKDEEICYWWVVVLAILMFSFIIIDGFSVYQIFYFKP